MTRVVHAIFENGVFRPVEKINVAEHQEVKLVIQEDIPTGGITVLAEQGGGFHFLGDDREDIYDISDGEPI